jgi:hypothetical protein
MAKHHLLALLLGALLLAEAALAARQPQDEQQQQQIQLERKKRKPKHPYSSPYGLFIQVRCMNSTDEPSAARSDPSIRSSRGQVCATPC